MSTLPPDFGRYAQVASGWATGPTLAVQNQHHSHSSPALRALAPGTNAGGKAPDGDRTGASPAWRRAIANKLGRWRAGWAGPWEGRGEDGSKAKEMLVEVLKRDEQSAGEGMYWGTEEEHEQLVEELNEEQSQDQEQRAPPSRADSHAPFSSVASSSGTRSPASPSTPATSTSADSRPSITQRRSFIDPTAPAAHSPDPKQGNHFLRPPTGSSSRRRRTAAHASSPLSGAPKAPVGTDPMLLELERKSRVGVKTRCAACGKQGYNFPATREGRTFCSRECRRAEGVAGVAGA